METTHGQAADGAALFLGDGAVVGVDELHDLRESALEGTFHGLREAHGRTGVVHGVLERGSLLGDVAVGEDDDHRLGLATGDQVVEDLGGTALGDPGVFIASDAVEDVEDRVAGLGILLITGRGVDGHTAVKPCGGAGIPYLGDGAVGNAVDGVQVAAGAFLRDKEDAADRRDVTVDEDVVRVNDGVAVDAEGVGVHFRGYLEIGGVFPHAVLAFFEVDRGLHLEFAVTHLDLLHGQEVTGKGNADGFRGTVTESDGAVFVDDGGFDAGGAEERLLGEGRSCEQEASCNQCEFLHVDN